MVRLLTGEGKRAERKGGCSVSLLGRDDVVWLAARDTGVRRGKKKTPDWFRRRLLKRGWEGGRLLGAEMFYGDARHRQRKKAGKDHEDR